MNGALRLQLSQASSAFTLKDKAAREDFMEDLDHGADVVSFTEVAQRHELLHAACELKGYQLVLSDPGDVALAIRGIHKLLDHGQVASVPAHGGSAAQGGHGPRPVLWASFRPFGTREHVTAHCGHWVTHKADTGGQQLELTQDLADVVRQHSQGARLGFWLGDTNHPDGPVDFGAVDAALRKGQLTSCWDELGRWPGTHGAATLDVVGSYDPDHRVSCERARVWPLTHSDHRAVSAWYSIRPARVL